MQIRQIALVANELKNVVPDLTAVLGVEVAYEDPGVGLFGLENVLIPIGHRFLEVVAPTKENTTAGRLLERRKGDGGYMVIIQVKNHDEARKRVDKLGVRVVWEANFEDAAAIHLHPRDVGGAILSFDRATPPESWRWAGPEWRKHVKTDVVSDIVGVELQASDPEAMAKRWAQVFGKGAPVQADTGYFFAVDGGVIRFVEDTNGRGDGVSGLDLQVTDKVRVLAEAERRGLRHTRDSVEICGTTFRLLTDTP